MTTLIFTNKVVFGCCFSWKKGFYMGMLFPLDHRNVFVASWHGSCFVAGWRPRRSPQEGLRVSTAGRALITEERSG